MLAQVEKALAQGGLAGALGILKRRVPHRFTCRLAGTLCHFDLENHDLADDGYLLLASAAALMPAFLRD